MLLERSAIRAEKYHDVAERLLEGLVESAGRHVDQAGGELGQERLEPKTLFQVDIERSAGGAAVQQPRDQQRLDDDDKGCTEEVPRQ
jgi:hypothetical protein